MTASFGIGTFPQHAALLEASAISVDVARERGYVSAEKKAELGRRGFGVAQQSVPALVIPLWSVTGEIVGYQLRPDYPRVVGDRVAKYETPFAMKMVLDCHPRVRPHLGDPNRLLVVTEGIRKADAAVTAGIDCVALLGVWNWRGSNDEGGKVALAAWEAIALNGRRVLIAFDSDVMLNPKVADALDRLGAFLTSRKANVFYAYLPSGDGGAKVGLDDFLAAGHNLDDLLALSVDKPRRPAFPPEVEAPDTFDDVPEEPGWRVLDDIAEYLERHIAWPQPAQRDAVALWITHTYLADVFDCSPRLGVLSPEKQCGKSRVLELVELLAHRPRFTVSMSPAYMYRAIEAYQPTLLIDEVDTIFGSASRNEEHASLRGLINAGFRRGATVGRMEGEGAAMVPKDFNVYSPVALAGIGDCLPDTVMDRSVIIRMRRRAPGETVEPLRRRRALVVSSKIARRIAAWSMRNVETIDIDPVMPDGIVDRPADTWEPLISIAAAAGGDWPARAAAACIELNQVRADADTGIGVRLLTDVASVFATASIERMFSATLVERLNDLEEAPWSGWDKGKGLKVRHLARMLGHFDVKSKNVRVGDDQRKGYERADLDDALARYLPPPQPGRTVPPSRGDNVPAIPPSDQHEYGWDVGTHDQDGGGRDGAAVRPEVNGHRERVVL